MQLASLEDEVLELHRRLADAEQRAAVAERIAAEEIAAKKAKAALGDKLAQAARAEKAENAALVRQVGKLKDELSALEHTAAAAEPSPKAGGKAAATPKTARRGRKIPKPGAIDPAPSDKADAAESLQLDDDHREEPSAEGPLGPASRSSNGRSGHLVLVLAIFAAILGWSLAIFGGPDSTNQLPPVTEKPSSPAVQATIDEPPQTAKTASTPAPDQQVPAVPDLPAPPKVTAAKVETPPTASDLQTRSLQNERIEQSVQAAKRANKQRAALQRRLTVLRKRLAEAEADLAKAGSDLTTAAQEADMARQQTALANAALARANKRNKRLLDANASSHFQTEAKLMAEIQTLRKALADARQTTAPTTTEAE